MLKNEQNKKKLLSKVYNFVAAILILNIILASCSKKEASKPDNEEPATVSISINAVASEETITPGVKVKNMRAAPKATTAEHVLSKETVNVGEFEMDIIAAEGSYTTFAKSTGPARTDIEKQKTKSGKLMKSAAAKLAANIPMEEGVKYWLVFYRKGTTTVTHSLQGTAGTPMQLDIVKNQDYEWFAYSYDDTDNIEAFNISSPQIQTRTDAPLLYAKGSFKATTSGNTPLSIIFKHQLQQIKVQLDTRGLFGDITAHAAIFGESDYVKTSAFDLLSGTLVGALTTVATTNLTFSDVDASSKRQKYARYYTADFSRKNYELRISSLTVYLPNGASQDLTASLPNAGVATFDFTAGGAGKLHYAKLDMWKRIPVKSILHIEGSSVYSYAASNPKKASGAFLREPINFGSLSNYLRVDGFTHEIQGYAANTLKNRL